MKMQYTVLGNTAVDEIRIQPDTDISEMGLELAGEKYAIAVDPSTSSTGIIIGNVDSKLAEYMIAFKREKVGVETQHTVYNQICYDVFDKWVGENRDKILAIKVEQPYKDKKQTQEGYAKQMASFHVYTGIAKKYGINCIIITALKWRTYFLADYKQMLNLDLRKSNKKEVHQVAASMQMELHKLPDDVTDAFGIWQHYLGVDYSDSGIIVSPGDNYRENTHKIFWVISSQERALAYIQSYLTDIKTRHPKAKDIEFIYNPKLSVENNIRAFTSNTTDDKYNLYYCQIFPTIGLIREILKFQDNIGKITSTTPLYVIGYRP